MTAGLAACLCARLPDRARQAGRLRLPPYRPAFHLPRFRNRDGKRALQQQKNAVAEVVQEDGKQHAARAHAEPQETGSAPERKAPAASAPFAVSGQLVHESADVENMGLAIRPPAGRSVVLVPDMDIGDSPAHAALQSALRPDGGTPAAATHRAEGRLDPATGGFALNQCRFVYRLPE